MTIVLVLVTASVVIVLGNSNIDFSYPNDNWVDRVLSLNQSGNTMIVGNLTVETGIEHTGNWSYANGAYECDNGTATLSSRNKTLLNNKGCTIP